MLRLSIYALTLFAICWGGPPVKYDVSYLWHADLQKVLAYKDSVSRVLGPDVKGKLFVVRNKRHYGLIYDRNGDASSTRRIAKIHTRILRSKGFDGAVPIKDWNWSVVQRDSAAPSASGEGPASGWKQSSKISLEARIESYIKRLRKHGRISANVRTAWSVYDLSSDEKLVTINENRPMQGASMVKPFFALAFFHMANEGKLHYGSKSRRMMKAMIQRSDNNAANWVLRRIGGPGRVQRLLKRYYGGIFRQTKIVEYIPSGGQTYRNRASAHDYSRFLYAIWHNNLPGSGKIKRLMGLPNRNRLYMGARKVPYGTKVYTKSGSTNQLCGEMGILVAKDADGKRYAYTLIALIEKDGPAENFTTWIRSKGGIIREVSNIVYGEMRRRYNLKGS